MRFSTVLRGAHRNQHRISIHPSFMSLSSDFQNSTGDEIIHNIGATKILESGLFCDLIHPLILIRQKVKRGEHHSWPWQSGLMSCGSRWVKRWRIGMSLKKTDWMNWWGFCFDSTYSPQMLYIPKIIFWGLGTKKWCEFTWRIIPVSRVAPLPNGPTSWLINGGDPSHWN